MSSDFEGLPLTCTNRDENGMISFDIPGVCRYVVETAGPLTFGEVAGSVIGLTTVIDSEGCLRMQDYDEIGWACIELKNEGRIIQTTEYMEGFMTEDDILDIPSPIQRKMKPLHVVELFAGIGATRKALYNLGIPHTSVISEIDKHAVKSYNAIHGDTPNLGDITKMWKLPPCDLMTYGFPCQDISIAGAQAGFAKGSGTRSGLLWEVERLLLNSKDSLPKVLIGENVAALVGKKNMPGFRSWLSSLSNIGYKSTWALLNANEFGVPQNRPRVFFVSSLDDPIRMPTSEKKGTKLRDVLHTVYTNGDQETAIRTLTTEETFKLMGFTSRDWWRAAQVSSDRQMYKQCGNSIVVTVLEAILRCIYGETEEKPGQKALSDFFTED